jgi:hypothetical protein
MNIAYWTFLLQLSPEKRLIEMEQKKAAVVINKSNRCMLCVREWKKIESWISGDCHNRNLIRMQNFKSGLS